MKKGEFFKTVFLGTILGTLFAFFLALAVSLVPSVISRGVQFWNERAIRVWAQGVGDPTSPSQMRAVMVCRDKQNEKGVNLLKQSL